MFKLGQAVFFGLTALAQSAPSYAAANVEAATAVQRIYTGADGASKAEVVYLHCNATLPAVTVTLSQAKANYVEDWHVTPDKYLVIMISGAFTVELSDHSKILFNPGDVAYFEDLTGKGHVTRSLADGTAMLVRLPANFDLNACAG